MRKIILMMRHAQISDSEEELSDCESYPTKEEIRQRKLLREDSNQRKARQSKLRPRMIMHLNDLDDD